MKYLKKIMRDADRAKIWRNPPPAEARLAELRQTGAKFRIEIRARIGLLWKKAGCSFAWKKWTSLGRGARCIRCLFVRKIAGR